MRVLVACEFSGVVRRAFTRRGHFAVSCDLIETDIPGRHYVGNVLNIIDGGWDLMIAHPPCTFLTVSGNRWFKTQPYRYVNRMLAVDFVLALASANISRICIENPIGYLSKIWCKSTQIIQPWQFGHEETKATCLWLKNLPMLQSTKIMQTAYPVVHYMAPSKDRWKLRSKTYTGIAEAMADQWS